MAAGDKKFGFRRYLFRSQAADSAGFLLSAKAPRNYFGTFRIVA
jgi:hypothetical protein